MKRLFAVFALAAVLVSMLAAPASAVGYDPSATYNVQAESAYIVNTDTNIIIYEKNSEQQVAARGLTKLISIALMLTQYGDVLDTTMITMPSAVSDYVQGTTHADIRIGETITLRQAIYAMMLPNANEAAMAAAYTLSGNDLTGWVSRMNSLSQKIGTTGSTWTDACGIAADNMTTARDMYLIQRYLIDFDVFVEIAGAYTYTMPANTHHAKEYLITSFNKMLSKSAGGSYYRSAIRGGKTDISATSSTLTTQSCVSWATQNGETYIFSIMNSPAACDDYGYTNIRPALYETTKLLDWVYASFSIQAALDTDEPLCTVKVKYSLDTDTLKLYPADSMMTILPSSSDTSVTQKIFNLPDSLSAPIEQGDVVGAVTLMLAGEQIGTVDLIAGQDVSRNSVLYTVSKLQDFFSSLYFRVVLVLSVLALTVYLVWFGLNLVREHNSKKLRRH